MLTRCPGCGTLYRVRPEAMGATGGQVRCGDCGRVFDAYACRDDTDTPGVGLLAEAEPGPTAAPRPAAPPPPGVRAVRSAAESFPWSGLVWVLGSLLLLLALAVQGLWWERERVAVHPEGLRLLQTLCRLAPCRIEPPRSPEQIEVLEHQLTPLPDPPDALRLGLTIRNRAPHPQPWPLLDLELSNRLGQPLAMRRFRPADYLPADSPPGTLLASGQSGQIILDLVPPPDAGGGYRFDLR